MNSCNNCSDKIIQKHGPVVLREEFDNWALLYNPDTGVACGVDPVGVQVWKLIDGTRSIRDICNSVSKLYSAAPESIIDDVTIFVTEIIEMGYIKIIE